MKSANIKVAVRIRPLLDDESRHGHTCQKLQVDQQNRCINAYNDRTSSYKNAQFDYVLEQSANQRKVYDKAGISDMVKNVVDGYHATIFAYGQTGSGKTFTMEGYRYQPNDKGIPVPVIQEGENEGIVPRSIYQLYEQIKKETSLQRKKFTVYCSYLQVYKEKIFDLLNKAQLKRLTNDGPGLKLKWNKFDLFTVENLYTFECKSPDDVLALYHFGIRNKVVSSHNMNNASSRSHSLLTLTVEQCDTRNPDSVVVSKLQLVDLAGSERQAFTGNVANKESIDINKSLFTLRQVITALTENKNQNVVIPYRESKLTCLLRQSLGGNSYCLMIACLNPCDAYIEENLNTLAYASRASYIYNKPIKNEDPKNRLIEELKLQNKLLTEELGKANETIQFLSQITGHNPSIIKNNLGNVQMPGQMQDMKSINRVVLGENGIPMDESEPDLMKDRPERQGSASSALTEKRDNSATRRQVTERIIKDKDNIEKFFKEKQEELSSIANVKHMNSTGVIGSNETKDAITERIIHTVNMMKEVLQSNLSLRETIQKQSEAIDDLNGEMFQLQNENEDLRDRLQVLEEFTGKDSMDEVSKLVKEKKVLENRVKHLEQTSMNWHQFQATRQQFHQNKERSNQSQLAMQPKATLEDKFNDDYEPVRCAMTSGYPSDAGNLPPQQQIQPMQQYTNGPPGVERRNSYSSKKKRKIQQLNYQKQITRGKSSTTAAMHMMSQGNETPSQHPDSRHQEYKIRTVRSLAQAYQQQQTIPNGKSTSSRPFYQNQGGSSTKFAYSNQGMNLTAYTAQNRNQSPFNGNYTQDIGGVYNNMDEDDMEHPQHRSKSPMLQTQYNPNKAVQNASFNMLQRQYIQTADHMRPHHQGPNQIDLPQPHVTLRKKDHILQQNAAKPPRTPNKYTMAQYRHDLIGKQGDPRGDLNMSADVHYHHNHTMDDGQVYENEDEMGVNQQTDEDEAYGEEMQTETDAYEVMVQQQRQRMGGLQGQLDVSLPRIRGQNN